MRVIAGTARGAKLAAPEGLSTRPTLDRHRETLFNILAPRLSGAAFLDLFAGSGANGIEALSRGAARAVLVDHSRTCERVIRGNLVHTHLESRAEVLCRDVREALQSLSRRGERFDLIFLDPPYAAGLLQSTLAAIVDGNLLAEAGWIVAERASDAESPVVPGLRVLREKCYRVTTMTFLALEDKTT